MHTETNFAQGPSGDEAVHWLWKEWANVLRVRNDGVPIVGFTWYSLTDQVDWDTALREDNGRVNPLGLYDLDRNIRAGGQGLQEDRSREWRDVLPTQSVCLRVPIFSPREADMARDCTRATRASSAALPASAATDSIEQRQEAVDGDAMRFKDKVAIVTGAASGIGLATAQRLGARRRARRDRRLRRGARRRRRRSELRDGRRADALALRCDVVERRPTSIAHRRRRDRALRPARRRRQQRRH